MFTPPRCSSLAIFPDEYSEPHAIVGECLANEVFSATHTHSRPNSRVGPNIRDRSRMGALKLLVLDGSARRRISARVYVCRTELGSRSTHSHSSQKPELRSRSGIHSDADSRTHRLIHAHVRPSQGIRR